jgi:hypothetical protein
MDATATTKGLLIIAGLFLGVYDLIVYLRYGDSPTISRVVYDWAKRYPWIVLLFGMLLGHLFIPQHIPE